MMREHIEKYQQKDRQPCDLGSHFGASCMIISRCDAFFFGLFLGTSGGTPLDQLWPPLGHPWSDFVDFFQDFRSKIGPKVKDSRATNSTNHTFRKKTGIPKQLYR